MATASLASRSPGGNSRSTPFGVSRQLKYANAQDLPSYPSPGLKAGDAAASAAASLGWAHATANADASLSPSLGSSDLTTSGSQTALLAAGWAQRHKKQQPTPPSTWGSSAANLAFQARKSPQRESQDPTRRNSVRAAKGSVIGRRPRARSSPDLPAETYPDQANAKANAMSAATIAHRPSMRQRTLSANEVGAVPYTTMDRDMFTSHPPVKPETDEQRRAQVLHASALAMAKSMYDQQQKMIDKSARAHARSMSLPGHDESMVSSPELDHQVPAVAGNSLQEAAYRLAQERLSKLQEEHQKHRDLQDYYGSPRTPQRTKFGTIKGKLTRKRSSSDGDLLQDRRRSAQIRRQTSLLNNKMAEVDEEKRAADQATLLATAQRNVKAQLQDMDEKLQSENGNVPGTSMGDWERKARVAAQARVVAAGTADVGKIDIGGGKFMDKSEVEKIAATKVQPLLDRINETAEKERERREQERLEEERRKEQAEIDRRRELEVQEIHLKLKETQREDEKARRSEIKHEDKLRKEEAKAIKAERKQAAREKKQKQKQKDAILPSSTASNSDERPTTAPSQETETKRLSGIGGHVRALSAITFSRRPPKQETLAAESTFIPASPGSTSAPFVQSQPSQTQKVRAWLFSRLPNRNRSKPSAAGAGKDDSARPNNANDNDAGDQNRRGFIGGVALARLERGHGTGKGKGQRDGDGDSSDVASSTSLSSVAGRGDSMRGVDMAGRRGEGNVDDDDERRAVSSRERFDEQGDQKEEDGGVERAGETGSLGNVSEGASSSGDEQFVEARSEPESSPSPSPQPQPQPQPVLRTRVAALSAPGATGTANPVRWSRFSEILE